MNRPPHIIAERRRVRCILAASLVGGVLGWLLIGELWGAVGLWVVFGFGVLLASAIAGLLNAGRDDR